MYNGTVFTFIYIGATTYDTYDTYILLLSRSRVPIPPPPSPLRPFFLRCGDGQHKKKQKKTSSSKFASKHLQPQKRVALIKRGFADSSEAVVDACRFMVCGNWFRDADYDLVKLLQCLDLVGGEVCFELNESLLPQPASPFSGRPTTELYEVGLRLPPSPFRLPCSHCC